MMTKRYLLLCLSSFMLCLNSVFAQNNPEKCATMQVLEQHKKDDPSLSSRMQQAEFTARQWLKNNKSSKKKHELNIPVVVHVIYHVNDSAVQNIPDSTIQSQIDVLNEDFRRMNPDTSNTRTIFDSIATDTEINFCMAQYDPMGNPTDGITRTSTTQNFDPFTNPDAIKKTSAGGKDPWPTDKYLNIWVCDMSVFGSVFVLGFAQFPWDDPSTDGVVIQYQHFGTHNDTTAAPADQGRTTVHEVGHWLGLRHIWGDGDCDSLDRVYDTPTAIDASQSNCQLNRNTCSNDGSYWNGSNPPDMVENYMDYSADACMNMFSMGQAERMWSFLFTDTERLSLLSSHGCDSTQMNAFTEKQNISCGTSCDGWAKVNPFNGQEPYSYLWTPGNQTTDSIGGLCAGNNSVRIIDAANDTVVLKVDVGNNSPLKIATSKVDANCASCADGKAIVSHYGGSPPFSYQWDDPSAQITTTASGLNPDWYRVTVTDVCGVEIQDSVEVLNKANSVDEYNAAAGLEVFPNPTDHFINLSWDGEVSFSNLKLFDITGRVVLNEQLSSTQNRAKVDVSSFRKGIYFLSLGDEKGQSLVREKIIVN